MDPRGPLGVKNWSLNLLQRILLSVTEHALVVLPQSNPFTSVIILGTSVRPKKDIRKKERKAKQSQIDDDCVVDDMTSTTDPPIHPSEAASNYPVRNFLDIPTWELGHRLVDSVSSNVPSTYL